MVDEEEVERHYGDPVPEGDRQSDRRDLAEEPLELSDEEIQSLPPEKATHLVLERIRWLLTKNDELAKCGDW